MLNRTAGVRVGGCLLPGGAAVDGDVRLLPTHTAIAKQVVAADAGGIFVNIEPHFMLQSRLMGNGRYCRHDRLADDLVWHVKRWGRARRPTYLVRVGRFKSLREEAVEAGNQ